MRNFSRVSSTSSDSSSVASESSRSERDSAPEQVCGDSDRVDSSALSLSLLVSSTSSLWLSFVLLQEQYKLQTNVLTRDR